jgi:SPP1 gp7 family putative phage head morphogenesis protein
VLTALEKAEYAKLAEQLELGIAEVARDGARLGVLQVLPGGKGGEPPDDLDELLELANEHAIEWAVDHAAELIKGIEEHTADAVRLLVGQALEDGWGNDELAERLEESGAFGEARAETIARTETAFADVEGNQIGWREAGVVEQKEWAIAQDEYCDDCQALDGTKVGLDDEFPGGVSGPPLHPNCRCDVLPVLADDE